MIYLLAYQINDAKKIFTKSSFSCKKKYLNLSFLACNPLFSSSHPMKNCSIIVKISSQHHFQGKSNSQVMNLDFLCCILSYFLVLRKKEKLDKLWRKKFFFQLRRIFAAYLIFYDTIIKCVFAAFWDKKESFFSFFFVELV